MRLTIDVRWEWRDEDETKGKHKITWPSIRGNCEYVSCHSVKNDERTCIEMIRSSGIWARIVSWVSSILHVLLTLFVGYLISAVFSARVIDPLVFMFAATSKLFAVAFTEDRNASKNERIYSTIALALLFPLLVGLSTFEMITGVLILTLYSLYPLVDGKAPFDVVHHVLRYVFIFALGYGSVFFNGTALLAILTIVFFSLAGELLAGLRNNSDTSKNAASLLGIKRSLIVIVSSIFIASLTGAFVFNALFEFPIQIDGTFVPFYIIPALAIDLFLTMHLREAQNGKRIDPFHLMRRKELIALLIMSLSILAIFQTGRINAAVTVDSRNYSFDVSIRTFIAGSHGWDVPWILFDYVNADNYYYVVFHTDGILELSQKINGQTRYYESSLKTQLTPFQWNDFHIVLNETTVAVTLDGEYQVSTTRYLVSDPSGITISVVHPTGFWITCAYTINVDQ